MLDTWDLERLVRYADQPEHPEYDTAEERAYWESFLTHADRRAIDEVMRNAQYRRIERGVWH